MMLERASVRGPAVADQPGRKGVTPGESRFSTQQVNPNAHQSKTR